MHGRFNQKVWTFQSDYTGALAKWLVKLSPYVVPDKLSICITEFNKRIEKQFEFNELGMLEVELSTLTPIFFELLMSVPEIEALNDRKNGRDGYGFSSMCSAEPDPDDDFIDIMALAQCMTVDFATENDARILLETDHYKDLSTFEAPISKI